MSNNILLATIVGVFFLLFAGYGLIDRGSRWAFLLWFPFTATLGIATTAWLFAMLCAIPMLFTHTSLKQALSAGMAFFLFMALTPCPIFFAFCLVAHPKEQAYSSRIVTAPIIGYLLMVIAVLLAPLKTDRVPIDVQCMTKDEQPVSGATISYETRPVGGVSGYSPVIKGKAVTDGSGHGVIFMRRKHNVFAYITKDDFTSVHFKLSANYGLGFHQTRISWSGANGESKPHLTDAIVKFPDGDRIPIKIYLPRKGVDTELPYPPYHPH